MGRAGGDLNALASRLLLGLAVAGTARRARAETPSVRPAPPEELSAEDQALLDVIDLLWEMPLLEEWDPEEDAPDPIVAPPDAAPAPPAPEARSPKP
jgi:hypothetical protein